MIPQQQQHTTKSSKRSATPPPPPPPQQQHPTQCHFYVKQKHRFCKRERAPNSLYCHTHTIFEHDSNLNSLTLETTTTMTTTTMTTMTTCLPQIPNDHSQPSSLKRVPCPIDPSHSVYEYRLKKHLKICNKSLSQNRMMQQPYYCPSIHYNYLKKNHPQDLNILYHNPQDLMNNDTNKDLYKNDRMISFQTIGDLVKNHSEYFKNLISKINHLYDHQLQIKTIIQDHMNENYNFLSDDEEFREKHHKQHCSIIYNIEHAHCLSNDFDYIEFGCGKGTLSYCVRRALIAQRREITMCNSSSNFNNNCRNSSHTSHESNNMVISNQTFILIDRENQRRKVDNFIKYGTRLHNNKNQPQDGMLTTEIVHVERILADIGDLDLSRVKCFECSESSEISSSSTIMTTTSNNTTLNMTTTTPSMNTSSNNTTTTPSSNTTTTTPMNTPLNMTSTSSNTTTPLHNRSTISISKHLCGIATDLTLCCLHSLNTLIPHKNKGIFIALCCHHKCTFDGYINKQFLFDCGINEIDFKVMTLLTSFATCQFSKLSNKNTSEEYGLSDEEKETIGLKCKRILDVGRMEFLKSTQQYEHVKLIYYCQKDVTLENCMLVAY